MKERLIKLLQNFADGTYTSNGIIVDGTKVDDVAEHLIANGVIVLPYNLNLPKELYRHMFDNDYNKVVVKCKVGKNTGYGFTLVHYRDGRVWNYKYTSIGKTVFLTKEEAEKALKECKGKGR